MRHKLLFTLSDFIIIKIIYIYSDNLRPKKPLERLKYRVAFHEHIIYQQVLYSYILKEYTVQCSYIGTR